MALVVLRTDTTCNGTILRECVAHTETYHCILILCALGKVCKELTDNHECITIVEVVTVDNAERLLDNILTHQHSMVCTPRLLTTFWY